MATKKWEYLVSSEFEIRKIIASHYLSSCDTIIDIGAFRKKLPIKHNATLHSIDPLVSIDNAFHGTFSEWVASSPYIHGKVGVALLGFDFEGQDDEYKSLVEFIKKVDIIVVEFAYDFEPSRLQVERLLKDVDLVEHSSIFLELPPVQTEGFPVFNKRKIHIAERSNNVICR